jgi:hypothetical protein
MSEMAFPTLQELLRARFNLSASDLSDAMARITDADLDWRPAGNMRTIRGLLLEIADKEREVIKWVQTGTWPDGDPQTFGEDTATLAEVKATMAEIRTKTFAHRFPFRVRPPKDHNLTRELVGGTAAHRMSTTRSAQKHRGPRVVSHGPIGHLPLDAWRRSRIVVRTSAKNVDQEQPILGLSALTQA